MSSVTLPDRAPFREMMATFTGDGVNLIMETKTLVKLRVWESTYIDLHAGEFRKLPNDLLVFVYSNRQWSALCTEMRHFDPEGSPTLRYDRSHRLAPTDYDRFFLDPREESA